MNFLRLLAPVLVGVALCGCSTVPATLITFDPISHQLAIRSPKDVELTNLAVSVASNGVASITLGSYVSKNNAEVVAAVATQNALVLKAAADLGGQLIGAAAARAAK